MQRVVLFGSGGAGKSVLGRQLGTANDLLVVELDKEFWNDRLDPIPIADWRARQRALSAADVWILDGGATAGQGCQRRLLDAIARWAPDAEVVVLRTRHAVTAWMRSAG